MVELLQVGVFTFLAPVADGFFTERPAKEHGAAFEKEGELEAAVLELGDAGADLFDLGDAGARLAHGLLALGAALGDGGDIDVQAAG